MSRHTHTPNQWSYSGDPVPVRGAVARRHERGMGCGGRESVGAQLMSQGGLNRERWQARRTTDVLAYGKTAWSWHPLLVSSRRRRCEPNRGRKTFNPPATVTIRLRRRGERGISRKAITQGMPDASASPVCSCAQLPTSLRTGPRVQRAPGIPCTLSFRG